MDTSPKVAADGSKTSKISRNHTKLAKKNVLKSNLQDVVELNADLDITMIKKTRV